ncbi:MAG: ATP phosphoribosyltransferase [Saprospiraceae bacterium]|nr:ATP phosphoribosyltransferase [Saprospiraceae bacterium]
MLRIAVQKSGRLYEESLQLLKDCGLQIDNGLDRLKTQVLNFPAEIYFFRNSDIPEYLADGVVDIAIIGENLIVEKQSNVTVIEKLGFSKCRLSIAMPKDIDYPNVHFLNGKKIATSYPVTLRNFLDRNNVKAEIHYISGSVEIAPNIGLSDAICDLVSSGSTLFKNGLEEKEIILHSEACITANLSSLTEKEDLISEFLFRLRSVLQAKKHKYILFNIPNDKIKDAESVLPVLKSPTILPLLDKDWSSMHTVIKTDEFWHVIRKLKDCGAQGILVVPIENMVI